MKYRSAVGAAFLLAFGAFSSCRTGSGPATVKEDAVPASVPVIALEGAIGSPAAALYDAASLTEANDGGTLKKSYTGRLIVHCAQAGALPPGAQGFPGPAKWSCAANVPLPAGVQGFPAPAFMHVEDQNARAVWQAFKGDGKWRADAGVYEKVYDAADGEFLCEKTGGKYRCTVGAPGSAANGAGSGAANEVLSLMGGRASVAGVVWNAMSRQPISTFGVARKSVTGRIAVSCTLAGAMPVCTANMPLPPGAQGFPPAPFLKIDGPAAKGFFEAFKVAVDANAKSFATEAGELTCSKGGNEQYGCTLRGLPAAPAAGHAALRLDGDAQSAAAAVYAAMIVNGTPPAKVKRGRLVVQCNQAATTPPRFECAANTARSATAFLHLDGAAAKAFWEALALAPAFQHDVGMYEKLFASDEGEMRCSRSGAKYSCTLRGL